MKKICVFCSASEVIDPSYAESAREIGRWIGENRNCLVYGGAALGLMEEVAKAAKASGAEDIGVVPSKFAENGKVSHIPDITIPSVNLSDRTDNMPELPAVLIAFHPVAGTPASLLLALLAVSIGYYSKKIILYNVNGFYDTLLKFIEEMNDKGFMRHPVSKYIAVERTVTELNEIANI